MNKLCDIMLSEPLSNRWLHGILFTFFSLHILFVLLAIGTAILAVFYFIYTYRVGKVDELRWDKKILRIFLIHKSLAVVLGLGPLLLIQVSYSIPFFNGISLFAPYWMLIIVLLIVAFLSFDLLAHKIYVHHNLHLFFGIVALISLLIVPCIFVLILVASENPDQWLTFIRDGYKLRGQIALHWLLRYLHVLGAAIVFGGTFHYFFTTQDDKEKKRTLLKWMMIGILFQFIVGPMLVISLPGGPDIVIGIFIIVGIFTSALLIWKIFTIVNTEFTLRLYSVVPLILIILISMLLARQHIQNRSFIPLAKEAEQNRYEYERVLNEYQEEAINQYKSNIKLVYNNGETIYAKSCAFCHGVIGDGKGAEAINLLIPPEDISSIRTTHKYLYEQIVKGILDTAMPYFAVFDRDKLESLIRYLNEKYNVLGLPEQIPVNISESTLQKVNQIYTETCSGCHGMDGKGSQLSRGFKPRPPDLTVFSLLPQRAFEVITDGYPGTVMPAFGSLPENVRWGLVKIINDKRIS